LYQKQRDGRKRFADRAIEDLVYRSGYGEGDTDCLLCMGGLRTCRMGNNNPVPSGSFGFVQSLVGALEKDLSLVRRFRESGHANGDRHHSRQFTFACGIQALDAPTDLFSAGGRLLRRTFGEEDDEFFSAEAAGEVFGSHASKEIVGNDTKRFIASGMAEGVVVVLEMIEIEEHDGKGAPATEGAVNFAVERLLHVSPVVKTSERIANGLEAQGLTQVETGNCECEIFCNRIGNLRPPIERG